MGEAKRKLRVESSEWTPEEIKILEEQGQPVIKRKRHETTTNTENTDFMDSQEFADAWDEAEREATIENLMAAQVAPVITQNDIPPNSNVFATMEAAWRDFVDHWVHIGLPDKYRDEALRLAFFVGVQSAANLMRYCEGQGEFSMASDQIQEEEVSFYQNEVKPKVDAAKADEWRTGEI